MLMNRGPRVASDCGGLHSWLQAPAPMGPELQEPGGAVRGVALSAWLYHAPVRQWVTRVLPALQLTRVTGAFAAVANVWFVVLWSRVHVEEPATVAIKGGPLWLLLAGAAANALGLFTFATALNDILDWRRDKALFPERPLPAGRMSMDQAVTLAVATFGLAVLGATVLGMSSVLLTLTVGGAILFFNATGKHIPAVGLVLLGLIYAGQMVVPNLNLRFVWPVWVVMTHALAVGAVSHLVANKSPGVSVRASAFAGAGWLFWSAVILGVGYWRAGENGAAGVEGAVGPAALDAAGVAASAGAGAAGGTTGGAAGAMGAGGAGSEAGHAAFWPGWVSPWAAAYVLALALLFALLVYRRVRTHGRGRRAADKIARYGALWLALYACAFMVAERLWAESIILGVLTLTGFLGMTVLREVFVLIEHPVSYRR